ncbi:MAG: hypothetical protein AB8E82_17490 [Aureispira sp.]
MTDLRLITTPEEELVASIFSKTPAEEPDSCYVISLNFYNAKGGGSSKILGVFLSKQAAAQAFISRVKAQFVAQNKAYRQVEDEDYFEEEPSLEYAEQLQVYRFQCENTFYDSYEWYLTRKKLDEIELIG